VAEPAVVVEKDGRVLAVTLNRPETRNAIDCESMCRLFTGLVRCLDALPVELAT
jgi:enoyl-CoA hydratase/carnithine racemase